MGVSFFLPLCLSVTLPNLSLFMKVSHYRRYRCLAHTPLLSIFIALCRCFKAFPYGLLNQRRNLGGSAG